MIDKNKGKLYIVGTPIGNLDDITLRAINTLKEADIIVAEDTRHSLKLLNHLGISKPLISYYRHTEEVKYEKILEKIKNEVSEINEKIGEIEEKEERVEKEKTISVQNLMNNMKWTLDQALDALGIKGKERTLITQQLQK